MTTLFTRIIDGELPGRFVWRDERVVAFLSINPLTPGHTLVVPRREVDVWTDADDALLAHLMHVARAVGRAQVEVYRVPRPGLVIAGFEVDHLHVHVFAARGLADFDFAAADPAPGDAAMDEAMHRLREALRRAGHGGHVPQD